MGKKYCISQSPFWKTRVWSFLISMLETQSNPGGPFQHAAFKFASTRLCQKALQPQKKNNPKLNLDRNFIGSFLVHQNSLGIFSCITKHPRRMLRWISKIIEPWALEVVYLTSHFKSVVLGFFLRVSTWRIFPVGTVTPWSEFKAIWKGNRNPLLRKTKTMTMVIYHPSIPSIAVPTIQPYPTPPVELVDARSWVWRWIKINALHNSWHIMPAGESGKICVFVNLLTDSANGQPSFLLGIVLQIGTIGNIMV